MSCRWAQAQRGQASRRTLGGVARCELRSWRTSARPRQVDVAHPNFEVKSRAGFRPCQSAPPYQLSPGAQFALQLRAVGGQFRPSFRRPPLRASGPFSRRPRLTLNSNSPELANTCTQGTLCSRLCRCGTSRWGGILSLHMRFARARLTLRSPRSPRHWPETGLLRPEFQRQWSIPGQVWAKLVEASTNIRPTSTKVGPRATVGQGWDNSWTTSELAKLAGGNFPERVPSKCSVTFGWLQALCPSLGRWHHKPRAGPWGCPKP